jgi:uncharacterized membrane protein
MFSKGRIEALSDAVFAIAMTLLILDIKVPLDVQQGGLGAALSHQSHEWVSFAISFMLGAIFWVHQHKVLHAMTQMNGANVGLSFLFLALISVLPFSAALWAHYPRETLAVSIYFLNQCLMGLVLALQITAAGWFKHVHEDQPWRILRYRLWTLTIVMLAATIGGHFNARNGWQPVILLALISRGLRKRFGWYEDRTPATAAQ